MQIFYLDDDTIAAGERAFLAYTAALACGPYSAIYDRGMRRDTGAKMIVGGILACLDRGIIEQDAVLNAVSRSTRCRRSTVRVVLNLLAGSDPKYHRWTLIVGSYYVLTSEQTTARLLMAA